MIDYNDLCIRNEYDDLRSVFMAKPSSSSLIRQFDEMTKILLENEVSIVWADSINSAPYQIFTRDPFFVIDDKIVLCDMSEDVRRIEQMGASDFLNAIQPSHKISVPKGTLLEGGDIIVHNNIIFVGLCGRRTDLSGLEFMRDNFGATHKIIPIYFQANRESILHLDCVFSPIRYDTVVIYPECVSVESINILRSIFANIINISEEECTGLAANLLCLGNDKIITQYRFERVNRCLTKLGFKTIPMHYYDTVEMYGYSRCLTCPLKRKSIE